MEVAPSLSLRPLVSRCFLQGAVMASAGHSLCVFCVNVHWKTLCIHTYLCVMRLCVVYGKAPTPTSSRVTMSSSPPPWPNQFNSLPANVPPTLVLMLIPKTLFVSCVFFPHESTVMMLSTETVRQPHRGCEWTVKGLTCPIHSSHSEVS